MGIYNAISLLGNQVYDMNETSCERQVSGLLYSRIGYDAHDPKHAVFRAPAREALTEDAPFSIVDQAGVAHVSRPVRYWGACWQDHWWVLGFTELRKPGRYRIELRNAADCMVSEPFDVHEDGLWRKTWRPVGLEQLLHRRDLIADRRGWQDCGSIVHANKLSLREVTSHAAMIIGLTDLLAFRGAELSDGDRRAVEEQVVHGCDYLAVCQDMARDKGFAAGALVHEIDRFVYPVPGEMPKSAVAFARAARLLANSEKDKAADYARRADLCLQWYSRSRNVIRDGVFPALLGAPDDFTPPDEPMTRDLLAAAWGAWELVCAGREEWRDQAAAWIEQVLTRQTACDNPEAPLYGHFRTFDTHPFTEKAWSHHMFGFNCGAVFPHYLLPFIDMIRRNAFPDRHERWKDALRDFAYGYLLPACRANPFNLLPNGCFGKEGLLWFCGLGHGMNAAYAWTAALALELDRFFRDAAFRDIAVGNLQWIAGLNAGLTSDAMAGCWYYRTEIGENELVPCSMINGIGDRSAGGWMDVPGAICNGFDVDQQFRIDTAPTRENDAPLMLTDEDWITHAGAWLSATSRLRGVWA